MYDPIERMKSELWSDLMNMVENGDLTDLEAMAWYEYKLEQWKDGV